MHALGTMCPGLLHTTSSISSMSTLAYPRSRGTNAKRWAEALAGLTKLDADAPLECESLIKCIALLSIFGRQVRLFPTQEVLSGIFAGDTFEPALQHLIERSIVMERRHERAAHSGPVPTLILNACMRSSSGLAGKTTADVMMSCFPASELSSLRHFIRTGAHRNFETRVVGAEAFLQAKEMTRLGPNRPGQVVFVLDLDGERKDALVEHAKALTSGKDVAAQQSLVAVSTLTSETEASARALAWKGLLPRPPRWLKMKSPRPKFKPGSMPLGTS